MPGDGIFLEASHAPTMWGGVPALPVLEVHFYLCMYPLNRITRFDMLTHLGWSLFLGVSHVHTTSGRAPSAPQLSGFFSIYAYTLCHRITKFDVVMYGDGICF